MEKMLENKFALINCNLILKQILLVGMKVYVLVADNGFSVIFHLFKCS